MLANGNAIASPATKPMMDGSSIMDLGQEAWLRYRPLPQPYAAMVAPFLGPLELCPELQHDSTAICTSLQEEYAAAKQVFLGDFVPHSRVPVQVKRDSSLPPEHFRIAVDEGSSRLCLFAGDAAGALYGIFRLTSLLQRQVPVTKWSAADGPSISLRLLNHWDNVSPKVDIERGYGGESLFRWDNLPDDIAALTRLNAYARLLASVGINGIIVNNVNVGELGSQLLRPDWLTKLETVGDLFRSWGIRIGISISYAAPRMLGELDTADPRDEQVRNWWRDRATEFYRHVPDSLGWLVKADSEGQPGPMDYGLNHSQGSRHLAEALEPHGGRLFWRSFVYGHDTTDIMTQPYQQFQPLDGTFPDNVSLQVKNGPRDFQVREPIHPLIGAMEKTPTCVEVQITQEYLGHDVHLCFLPSQWETYLKSPAQAHPTVADFLTSRRDSALVGVANTNDSPNWTGHLLAQANLYGFARMAWNPTTTAARIARDWSDLTFDSNPPVSATVSDLLLESWTTFEGYTSPFALGQFYNNAETWDADHFDPAPWRINNRDYFRAEAGGVGVARGPDSDSGLLTQYPPALRDVYSDPRRCPEELLLFFHHLPWDWRMADGETLVQSIYNRYHDSAARVDDWIEKWLRLQGRIDPYRHAHVLERLQRQRLHARLWARYMTSFLFEISQIPDQSGRTQ